MVTFSEIAARITGFSIPIFGLSWNPPPAQITIARQVLDVLGDRRVLYELGERQVPEYCTCSVRQIREYLTSQIAADTSSELSGNLKAIRSACRRFLDFEQTQSNWQAFDASFSDALGQFRSTVGQHIAIIAVKYQIDIEDQLASILPKMGAD